MATVLITSEFFGKFDGAARAALRNAGHTVIDNPYGHTVLTPEKIIPYIAQADAIICDLEKINADVLAAAKNLKIVARRGVGVDSVDTKECARRGITVTRTVGLVETPVAELVLLYLLELSRGTRALSTDMHDGKWNKRIGHNVQGKTLGLVGMGNIGRQVAVRAAAFGLNILYADPVKNEQAELETGARQTPLDALLAMSDFISLHLPLNECTRGLINESLLKKVKPGACLINTARGGIVDEKALTEAVISGRIGGAAIDVFDAEPQQNSLLRGLNNVILTPHVATFTIETFVGMDNRCAENIIGFFK